MLYTIIVKLTDADTSETYTEFQQAVYDNFVSSDFNNVIDKASELVDFVKKHYDTVETYEISMYILNDEGVAIY
tara:strand:+ start:1427 stop:1648 length:222 start_codon:yes stop_codon:yes gene_type:complete